MTRPPMTKVMNLLTGETQLFSMAPELAVVSAFQQGKGDFNWWTYPKPAEHPEFRVNTVTVSCGDYTAFKRNH